VVAAERCWDAVSCAESHYVVVVVVVLSMSVVDAYREDSCTTAVVPSTFLAMHVTRLHPGSSQAHRLYLTESAVLKSSFKWFPLAPTHNCA
jgi:hypothetical protein